MKELKYNEYFKQEGKDFINYLLIDKKYSEYTILAYKTDLDKFFLFFKDKSIENIDKFDLREYVKYINIFNRFIFKK